MSNVNFIYAEISMFRLTVYTNIFLLDSVHDKDPRELRHLFTSLMNVIFL